MLSTITKIPSEERKKKPCLLANTFANEPVGRHQEILFLYFIPFLNFFGEEKNIKKCVGILNDQVKRNNGI